LLIAESSSGKIYYMTFEMIKLRHLLNCGECSAEVIISDKKNDSISNECFKYIKMKVIHCSYENAVAMLNSIIKWKAAYDQIIQNNLEE
jgi:hypothetical protein